MTITRWQAASQGVYRWGSKFRATIALNFTFNVNEYSITELPVGYEILSSIEDETFDKMAGEAAPATQEAVNNLPLWTKARLDPESNTFLFVNSVGQHLEYLHREVGREQNNLFITTADLKEISKLYKTSDDKISNYNINNQSYIKNITKNLLNNSFFELKLPSRYNKAKYWTGQYSLSNDSLFGTNSVYISNLGTIQQFINLSIQAKSYLTLSFSYKTNASSNILEENKFSSLIHIIYEDESRKIVRKAITPKDIWSKHVQTIFLDEACLGVEVQICLKNSSIVNDLYIDCVQLEVGSTNTEWHPNFLNIPSYLPESNLPVVIAGNQNKKLQVNLISDKYTFLYYVIPTRIQEIKSLPEGNAYSNNIWSRFVEYTKDSWPSEWIIANNNICRENILVKGEIPFVYSLIEESVEDNNTYSLYTDYSYTHLSMTVKDNIIYLLSKEIYDGVTKYFIKFVRTTVSKYSKEYLEVLGDLEVDLSPYIQDLSEDEQVTANSYQIALFDNSTNYLIIKLPNGQMLLYRLYYDYAYIDVSKSAIYCREDYSKEYMKLTIFG